MYSGPSMYPTFRPGDLLHASPCPSDDIRIGDVILIARPSDDRVVVHRVVGSAQRDLLITRGDNNPQSDGQRIRRSAARSRITHVTRNGRRAKVRGGLMGLMAHFACRARRRSRVGLARLGQPLYRFLAARVARRLSPFARTKIVRYSRGEACCELHLTLGSRRVGRLIPGEKQWRIEFPYRLLIDESSLPSGDYEPGRAMPTGLRAEDRNADCRDSL